MKLKKLFLGVAVALGLVSVAATTANAAEGDFVQDFNNTTDGAIGTVGANNPYTVYSTAKVPNEIIKLETHDNASVLHYGIASNGEDTTKSTPKITFRVNGGAESIYNQAGNNVWIQLRYKNLRDYGARLGIYHKNLGTIQFQFAKGYLPHGNGNFNNATWVNLDVVISKTETGSVIHCYINGEYYQTKTTTNTAWDGTIQEIYIQSESYDFTWEGGYYIDYLKVSKYETASASVQGNATVKATESIDLPTPVVTGNPSIPNYKVVVEDKTVAEVSDGKIWGLKEGTTKITYDFADELITDVSLDLTVEPAPALIVVSDIVQTSMFGKNVVLVEGMAFELNEMYSALPASASNANLSYEVVEGDAVKVEEGKLVAVKAGEAKLKVSATGEDAYNETFDIIVKNGNYTDLNSYEVGTTYTTAPDQPTVFTGWQAAGYSTYRDYFAEIEIVNDDLLGKAIQFTGKGTGSSKDCAGSRLETYVSANTLTVDKDYKLAAWVKVDNVDATDANAKKARLDLKMYGYSLEEGVPKVSTVVPFANTGFQIKDIAGQGWVYVELGNVNLDSAKEFDGIKVELIGFDLASGVKAYIAGAHLVEQDTVTLNSWNVVNQGKTVELTNEAELQIVGTTVPSAATLPTLTYTSSDEEVATVSETGLIKAGTKEGTATITITDGTTTKTITVVVDLVAEDVEISEEAVEMNPEQELTFDLVVTPSYGTSVFTATSSNPEVATVSIVDGKVVINSLTVGTTTVVISTEESEAEYTFTVTVSHAPTLNLSSAAASIMVTQTVQIEATANYIEGTIQYVSDNTAVATVDANGLVTAVKVGQATITVSVDGLEKTFTVTVTELVAQELTLAANSGSVKEGKTLQIEATVVPAGRTITYTSSDATVATVSATGLVTAVKAGTATITVTSDSLTKTYTVTVIEQTKIELAAESVTIKENKTHTIDVTVTPSSVTYTFVSSNPTIASVTADGIVKGLKPGTVTITITADDKTATFTVVVEEQTAQAISVNKDKATLEVGKTVQLEATVVPANRTITYTSNNTDVATVDANGKVTAVAAGKAVITVKSDDKTVEVEITVVAPEPTPEPTPTPTPEPTPLKGCKGSLIGSLVAVATLAGAALILKKKKDEE